MSQHKLNVSPDGRNRPQAGDTAGIGLSSFPVPAALLNAEGLVLRAPNRMLADLLGYELDDLVGLACSDIVRAAQLTRIQRAVDELDGGPTRIQVRLEKADGSSVDARMSIGRLHADGAEPASGWNPDAPLIVTIDDVAMAPQAAQTDVDPDATREASPLMASDPVEDADRLLQRVGHDLRHPLTIIAGYAHLLAAKGPALDDETRGRLLETLASAAIRAAEQVTSMMETSQVTGERPTVNLHEVAGWIEGLTSLAFENVGGVLITDICDSVVPVDGSTLRQIMLNLVNNALTHAHGDAPLQLHLTTQIVADGIELIVTDNGAGIPDDKLGAIFDKGVRLDPTAGPGLGSGLAACRELAEAAGGMLTAVPFDGGARFVLWLPQELAPDEAEVAAQDVVTQDADSHSDR